MTKIPKISPEVLIYIQHIKQYFNGNEDAQKYFAIGKEKEEEFYDHISKIAQQNFEENGEPELSVFQFEEIRREISKLISTDKSDIEIATGVFISIGNLGYLSLN